MENTPAPLRGDVLASPTRLTIVGDVLALQGKLLLVNLHNFILIPATLAAACLDLVIRPGAHGSHFYRVLGWGRRAEESIGVYRALDKVGHAADSQQTAEALPAD